MSYTYTFYSKSEKKGKGFDSSWKSLSVFISVLHVSFSFREPAIVKVNFYR